MILPIRQIGHKKSNTKANTTFPLRPVLTFFYYFSFPSFFSFYETILIVINMNKII